MSRIRFSVPLAVLSFLGQSSTAGATEPAKETPLRISVRAAEEKPPASEIEKAVLELKDQETKLLLGKVNFLNQNPSPAQVHYLDSQGKVLEIVGAGDSNGSGLSLETVDGALVSQLGLPSGQGLVVTSVAPDSSAARVGLSRNDLLLTLDDKPLSKPEDLADHLKAAGEKQVTIRLLRAGKTIVLPAKPVHRVILGVVPKERRDYYVGVVAEPVDDVLRSQLGLTAEKGLVVRSVENESPAAKGGLKAFDILLSIDDHSMDNREALVGRIQASQGKTVKVKVLRVGKPVDLEVTPIARHESALKLVTSALAVNPHPVTSNPVIFRMVRPNPEVTTAFSVSSPTGTGQVEKRLDDAIKELKALHKLVDELQRLIKEKEGSGSTEK